MLFHTITFSLFLVLCSGAKYGQKGKYEYRNKFTCSGSPIGDLRTDGFALNGRWYNKFFVDTISATSGRPTNATVDFVVKKNSNRGEEFVSGNNPADGKCLVWKFRDFQIAGNFACFAEKGIDPETCVDEEWIHHRFANGKLLFFFFCADEKPGPNCKKFLARCLSRTPYISKKDKWQCQKFWTRFNLGSLPEEDRGSANNACDRPKHNDPYSDPW